MKDLLLNVTVDCIAGILGKSVAYLEQKSEFHAYKAFDFISNDYTEGH